MEKDILRDLQMMELDILLDVVDLCNKFKLRYYLIGGTLLGAIRHGGFIPWDDDIDIGMSRDDYERLIELWDQNAPENLVMQNKEKDKRVHLSFTKIRRKNTRIIEKETKNSEIFKGVFIDIFPLDAIASKDNLIMNFEYALFNFLTSISLYKNGYREYRKSWLKWLSASMSFLEFHTINSITYRIVTKYRNKESKYITSYASGYGYKKQRMNFEQIYGQGVEVLFEGYLLKAPSNFEGYLKHLFGDYMKLPPIEKRGNQHHIIEISLTEE
ncbi:MAG: LicD family protein [Clostridia bacterium]|nr:LicD family protein [Clostridia bacterium]